MKGYPVVFSLLREDRNLVVIDMGFKDFKRILFKGILFKDMVIKGRGSKSMRLEHMGVQCQCHCNQSEETELKKGDRSNKQGTAVASDDTDLY